MIERLIVGLRGAGIEPTAREIADALWLADQMQCAAIVQQSLGVQKEHAIVQQPPDGQSIPLPLPPSRPTPLSATTSSQERAGLEATPELRTSVFAHNGSLKAGGLSFRSPTATALSGRLALGRALRPFKRRVPSRIQVELDEAATAERISRGLRPTVVVRPATTRWLDLALIIDAATSMSIWRQHVVELRALMVQCGAFRDVRVFQLVSDEKESVPLFAGMPGSLGRSVSERELCDPSGRRLVLIVSDCVAPAWSDGRIGSLIREWGRQGPTAILQVLPERLWDRSGLGDAPKVRLKAASPSMNNTTLRVETHPWTSTKDVTIVMPVVELDASRVAEWAAMLVGRASVVVSGVILDASNQTEDFTPAELEDAKPSADERVVRFLSMATAGARKLAVLFAAAPLTLPVMQIIRETMAPETTPGHFAEVFLGGLLREASEDNAIVPEHVAYDFWPGVRERLLDSSNAKDATRVLEEASAYITEHMGSTVDFRAWLADPAATNTVLIKERDRPFATIGAAVLRRLGGEYKLLAERLDSTLASVPDPSAPAASMTWIPALPDTQPQSAKNPTQAGSGAVGPTFTTGPQSTLDVVGPENGYWLLVDGTDNLHLPQHHLHLAEALGAVLANTGFSVITLGGQGVAHIVARAFMVVLKRQGYSSGIYRMLHVVTEGRRPDFRDGGRELTTREPPDSAALKRADAVLRIGFSNFDGVLLEGAKRAGKPYLTLSEPLRGPTLASYMRFVEDQIHSVCMRLNINPTLSQYESLFHQAAIALEQEELATYEQTFATVARRSRIEVPPETALQLIGDKRRPSHRLVGYSVFSNLPLDVLIDALVTERQTVSSFHETRPLWNALQALHTINWTADAQQARILAAAIASIQIELESDGRVDPGGECKSLLLRAYLQNRATERATAILEIARNYEVVRETMAPGGDRTARMTALVENARRFRQDPVMPEAEVWFTSGREGQRIVAIALLLGSPEPAAYSLLEEAIRRPQSPFEQYTAMRVTLQLLERIEDSQRASLRDAIEFQRGPDGIIDPSDESRWRLSTEHLERISRLRGVSPREVSAPTAGWNLATSEPRAHAVDTPENSAAASPVQTASARPDIANAVESSVNALPTLSANKADIGIITLRDDEFRAVLDVFPDKAETRKENREYSLRYADAGRGMRYIAAILRLVGQGQSEAQNAVRDLLEDLRPKLVLVVGIGGGLPSRDVKLGDVVVSTRIYDYTVATRQFEQGPTYSATGGPVVEAFVAAHAHLAAHEAEMGDWATGLPTPPQVNWTAEGRLYGPPEWQSELRSQLERHYEKGSPRAPSYMTGPIASSDRGVKDPSVLIPWLTTVRDLVAVEMESSGVYRAAQDRCPMLAIRGISDIVGLKRSDGWTKFACASAAAFTRAFLRTQPIPASLPEDRWVREQQMRQNTEQRDHEAKLAWLRANLEEIRSGKLQGTLIWLWHRTPSSDKQEIEIIVRELTEQLDAEIAQAAEEGWRRSWRTVECPLPHEKEERSIVSNTAMIGLVGISADLKQGLDLVSLSADAATHAARLATHAMNRFPPWIEPLVRYHGPCVQTVFGACIRADYDASAQHDVLGLLAHAPQPVQEICAPVLAELIRAGDPRDTHVLEQVLEALLSLPAQRAILARLAPERCSGDTSDLVRFALWWSVWFAADPEAAVERLASQIAADGTRAGDRVLAVCERIRLWIERDQRAGFELPEHAQALTSFLAIVLTHVHPSNDVRHVGAYVWGTREHAERLRGLLIQQLSAIPGQGTVDGLVRLGEDPRWPEWHDWLLSFAEKRRTDDLTVAANDLAARLSNAYQTDGIFLRVRHLATRESPALVRDFIGHTYVVADCAVTLDGKRVVSASWDKTLKVWDLETGRELATLKGHAGYVTACAITLDGGRVVSASRDKTLKVWDLETGRELATLKGHAGYVSACAITLDGRRVVSASWDKMLKVWDLESGHTLATLEGHADRVNVCAMMPDGKSVVSASNDRTLKVWDLASGRALATLEGHAAGVTACAVMRDGRRVVSTSEDKTAKVWDLESNRVLATLEDHDAIVGMCAVMPGGRRVALASGNNTLKVWDLETARALTSLSGHTATVLACAVTPDGKHVVSASADHTLKLWDLATGHVLAPLESHANWVTACAVTPDGTRVVSASADTTLMVWDLTTGRALAALKGHVARVNGCAVTPDGRRVVSASWDKTLKVWDLTTGRALATLEGHTARVTACAVTPDGRRVVSASDDRTLKVWDLGTKRTLATLEGHASFVTTCTVTPDGGRVVSASDDRTLKVWDLATGRALATLKGHADWVTACAVTPDGKHVVSASNDQTLKVWDLATGRALATLEGHTYRVTACAVTPDGKHVVSASWDKTLKVWDLESSACILTHLAGAAYQSVAATATAIIAGDCVGSVWFLDWPSSRTRPAVGSARRSDRR